MLRSCLSVQLARPALHLVITSTTPNQEPQVFQCFPPCVSRYTLDHPRRSSLPTLGTSNLSNIRSHPGTFIERWLIIVREVNLKALILMQYYAGREAIAHNSTTVLFFTFTDAAIVRLCRIATTFILIHQREFHHLI